MKAESLIALLDTEIARLKKLEGEEIGGFFFVMPPQVEDPITEAFMGTGPSVQAFYTYLKDKLMEAQKPAEQNPYVGMPGFKR